MSASARRTELTATVCVCAYTMDRWDVLGATIQACLEQMRDGDELILVADHAPRLQEAAAARFPQARVIPNTHARGLSGARNSAVRASSTDVLVFLDDDAVPCAGWLDELLEPYAAPQVVGVGGWVQPAWPDKAPSWLPPEFLWVVGCSYEGLPKQRAPIRNPIGANMSFRSAVFAQVGLFSESLGRVGTLPVGCEETELGIRVGRHYGPDAILHQPSACVEHRVTPVRSQRRYFYQRCWSEGRSKAAVSRSVGRDRALASERSYVTRTLPAALARELRSASRGNTDALARAATIPLGALVSAVAYFSYSRALRSPHLRPRSAG
ncbi:MAG: glycosyltransferase family 2 protein [Solirubrobacteraceae bacterium]